MSLQVEKLEKNMIKLTIEASAEDLEKAIQKAYLKNKGKISVPGFRKGKVPRAMVEKMYGVEIFYDDAANELIPEAYQNALAECDEEIVSQPKIEVTQIEKGKPFIFTAEVAVKPEVTLGEYKGVEVEKTDAEVTEEEVVAELNKVREQNSRTVTIEDRAIQDKDIAIIDFEGFIDGEAFEGGKGESYSLTIGSHSFIDTFEEQLIGKNIGEKCDINVTFPEEYHAKELAGKPATFKVEVKEIKVKELPELNDDFAQDVSEFDTLDAYKADVKAKLEEKKKDAAEAEKETKVIDKLIENATMEIPEAMIQTQVRQMADDFSRRLQAQGLTIEQYFQFTGLTPDRLFEDMKPNALKKIQSRLVLEAVAAKENIQVTDEDLENEIKEIAEMYKMEADKIKEVMGEAEREQMKKDIAVTKAVEIVVDSAKEI